MVMVVFSRVRDQASSTYVMWARRLRGLAPLLAAAMLAACGEATLLPPGADQGPRPTLAPPVKSLIPTLHVAPAEGWPAGGAPRAPASFTVTPLAQGLDHPRWLYVLPNGDVLVAETNKPAAQPPERGIKAWVAKLVSKRAGAGVPSAERITLLRDVDGDGRAELRSEFLAGLHSPFGMALVGADLYVANSDGIVRFPYQPGQTRIAAAGTKVTDLPAGTNHHWTKNILASRDGRKLYATVGSNSNVADRGLAVEEGRAAIWEVDVGTGAKRLFASGLRNPNGMGWEPNTGALWTVANERDELGSDLVPDFLTSVRDGAFYGWPWSYWGAHVDDRVKPQRPDMVERAVVPDYALGAHVAALGLAFADRRLPPPFASGAFVGEHGSWNRRPHSGYKVVFVPFAGGRPAGQPIDFLTGFLSAEGKAYGRPVGVAIDARGAVLVADDVGNTVWRVAPR
jgi:glucose/arabinose dehydrogenase